MTNDWKTCAIDLGLLGAMHGLLAGASRRMADGT